MGDNIIKDLFGNSLNYLQKEAVRIRNEIYGKKVYIRGLIEFSNYCARNCLYCGLRKDNRNLKRYRMTEDEIIRIVEKIYKTGIKTVVLQSGDDFFYTERMLCSIINRIKRRFSDMVIALSLGERKNKEYKSFFNAGAERYLLKHETIDERIYARLHPNQSLKRRIEILELLKDIGYEVGCGIIVGLPGQTVEVLIKELEFIKRFKPDMLAIGPFIPQKHTPMAEFGKPKEDLVLKIISIGRIISKYSNMPSTTALASNNEDGSYIPGLNSGCNVIMCNFTPDVYSKKYKIYDNKLKKSFNSIILDIKKAGCCPSYERGYSEIFEKRERRGVI